jgi:hypothetical protein
MDEIGQNILRQGNSCSKERQGGLFDFSKFRLSNSLKLKDDLVISKE